MPYMNIVTHLPVYKHSGSWHHAILSHLCQRLHGHKSKVCLIGTFYFHALYPVRASIYLLDTIYIINIHPSHAALWTYSCTWCGMLPRHTQYLHPRNLWHISTFQTFFPYLRQELDRQYLFIFFLLHDYCLGKGFVRVLTQDSVLLHGVIAFVRTHFHVWWWLPAATWM